MSNTADFTKSLYALMLQKRAQDEARQQAELQNQRQTEQDQFAREQWEQSNIMAHTQQAQHAKDSEFNRLAKVAELQGQYGGQLGEAEPDASQYSDPAQLEYAQLGHQGGAIKRSGAEAQAEQFQDKLNATTAEKYALQRELNNQNLRARLAPQGGYGATLGSLNDPSGEIQYGENAYANKVLDLKRRTMDDAKANRSFRRWQDLQRNNRAAVTTLAGVSRSLMNPLLPARFKNQGRALSQSALALQQILSKGIPLDQAIDILGNDPNHSENLPLLIDAIDDEAAKGDRVSPDAPEPDLAFPSAGKPGAYDPLGLNKAPHG